jgi:arabinogalactan oligomer/maltooligosaccharide transport system substrate-binding protein
MGGYIFGKNDKGGFNPQDVGLNKPGAVEAVTFLKKFYTDKVFPAGILGDNGLNAIDAVYREKAAAVINGPWASSRMKPLALTMAWRRCRPCRTASR